MPMLNIITCFEVATESKCIGLYRSIDRYLHYPAGARIFGVCPRSGHAPSKSAILAAEKLGVEYIELALNTEFLDYGLANKPFACDHIARLYPDGPNLFLDSDTLFLNDTALEFLHETELSLRPVDHANIGISSFHKPNGRYWKYLYDSLQIDKPKKIAPTNGSKPIYEYYNSGFIYSAKPELFHIWLQFFIEIMRANIHPEEGLFYVEQSTLSAVISSLEHSAKILPSNVNYPIHMQGGLPSDSKLDNYDELLHIHYHRIFQDISTESTILQTLDHGTFQGASERIALLHYLGFVEKALEINAFLDWSPSN
ncbi:MAG: hypothetical protein ABJL18_02050 [Hyphomicrobiales bacterium]